MNTATLENTRSTPLVPSRLAEPPPGTLDLLDADIVVGWVRGDTVGFHGFADENDAMNASWVAYRAMARRVARRTGHRPPPIDGELLTLSREGERDTILAGGRPIATLVRPRDMPTGDYTSTYGFELEVPAPMDEATVATTARLVYRTLRRSGIRWSMWDDARARAMPRAAGRASSTPERPSESAPERAAPMKEARRGASGGRSVNRVATMLAAVAVLALSTLTLSSVFTLFAIGAALLAAVALASLVRLVVADLRGDLARRRDRRTGARPEPGRLAWAASMRDALTRRLDARRLGDAVGSAS